MLPIFQVPACLLLQISYTFRPTQVAKTGINTNKREEYKNFFKKMEQRRDHIEMQNILEKQREK